MLAETLDFSTMNDLELTTRPEALFNQRLTANELMIYGRKLGDPVSTVNLNEIETITLEKAPDQAKALFGGPEGDLLYEADGKTHVFSFAERINSVIRDAGCFHMKQPVTFIIDVQRLIGIKLYCEKAGLYQDIRTQDIEKQFGQASTISKDYFEEDGSLASTLFSYEERQTYIYVSGWNDKITTIHFGVFPFTISWRKASANMVFAIS